MLTATALAFAVNIAGGIFNWIFQKAGRLTTQIVLFILALIFVFYVQWGPLYPGFVRIVEQAVIIFGMAVGAYEVLLGYFPMFKGPTNTSI